MLNYEGIFSYKIMLNLGEQFSSVFENILPPKIYRSSYFIFNELIQNVSHYSSEIEKADGKEYGCGSINVSLTDNRLILTIKNKASELSIKRITEKVGSYNKLSIDELKQLSKEKRKSDKESDSKGGGIGLIEIRKRAKTNIEYEINNNKEIKLSIILNVGE